MTNSPPANVKIDDYQVLASGIDTLYLAIYVSWYSDQTFNYLDKLKDESKDSDYDSSGSLITEDASKEWKFNIKPHGSKGYSWILVSNDYVLKIGNWIQPCSRPSLMVEIRSETLWRIGVEQSVNWILQLIRGIGTRIIEIKPSRVDLCVDMIVPSAIWSDGIMDYAVTRARDSSSHRTSSTFTGVSIGKGDIIARIYDKAFEVIHKSKKIWMFDIWKIDQVPDDKRVIRIEFQLRRIAIKSLGMDRIVDLFEKDINGWVYLTTNWLKFQDRPGTHHTQRNTLPWWSYVQDGYKGSQGSAPAIRVKAFKQDKKRLILQMFGLMTSLQTLDNKEKNKDNNDDPTIDDCLHTARTELNNIGKTSQDVKKSIQRKEPKYHRTSTEI